MTDSERAPRALLIYFSFSGQTSAVLHRLASGLASQGVEITMERLHPETPLRFPIGTIPRTLKMMFSTFLRRRVAIDPLSPACFSPHDLIILAGPTWSYNPSGPILSLLDRDGEQLLAGSRVLPIISCRRYWRSHFTSLKRRLLVCGATVVNRLVFTHPSAEPFLTLGVFLKLAGRNPEKSRLLGKWYRKYGHSQRQLKEAEQAGKMIGDALRSGQDVAEIAFPPV